MRGPRRLWIALGWVLLVAGLVAATIVLQRRVLAERALVRWLGARGVASSPRVSRLGLGGLELQGLSVGTTGAPDLAIDRISVRWSAASLIGRRATSIEVFGARLRGRWEEGRLSLGALEALLRTPGDSAAEAPRLPVDVVTFHDARIDLVAPMGQVTAHGDVAVTLEPRGTRARGDLHAETPWGAARLVGEGDLAPTSERPRRWKVDLFAPSIEVPGGARVTGLAARGRGAGAAIRARFKVERATPTSATPSIQPLRLTGTLGGSIERLVVDATAATVQDGIVVHFSGEMAPLAARAELVARLPETALDDVRPGRLFPALDGVVTEARGTVAGEGYVRLRDRKPDAKLTLAFRNVDLVTGAATVRQLDGVVTVVGPPGISTPPGQMIAMAGVEGALPLQNGVVVFALEPGATLWLERAEWGFAEGTVRTSGRVPLAANDRTLVLAVDSLDVETLLASLAFEGLSGTGKLSGAIPLRLRGDALVVESGHLEATGPGRLRYERPAGAAVGTGRQQLDVLLAVLTNFDYDELALTLSGDTTKPMDMTLHIRGRNPGYQDGRPVVFNVKVEAPLAGLVRAGRSTYRVPPAIEKKLEAMGIRGAR